MALRISRRVCTLGRPRALGAGTKGSMWNHSASDKSVWYALLMLGTLPSHYLRTPFRTVSLTDILGNSACIHSHTYTVPGRMRADATPLLSAYCRVRSEVTYDT